jgi:5'-3' exonuclease
VTATAVQVEPKRPVVLVDLSAIVHRAWHAAADQPLSVAFQASIDAVNRCANFKPGALVAVCCDAKTNWRKKVDPNYKSNRERKEAAFYDCFDRIKERLRADAYLLWEVDGFEADDVIASAVDGAVTAGHEVVICSADKDLTQLMKHEGVSMLRTSTWDTMDAGGVLTKFGVMPNQMGDWLALVGDASDGIAGVPSFGPKTAAELLSLHGSIEGLYDAMAAGTCELKGKKLESLNASLVTLELARKLVALRYDVPIKFEEIYEVRKQKPIAKGIEPMPGPQVDFDDVRISSPPVTEEAKTPAPEVVAETMPAPANDPVPTAPPPPSVALITTTFDRQLEPQSPGQAVNLAARLHNARLYPNLGNEDAVLAVVMRGRAAGLPAAIALETFRPVQGRMAAVWQYIVDQAQRHPDCEYLSPVEVTESHAIWEGKHKRNPGPPFRLKVTIDQMKKTNVYKKDGAWEQRPEQMLTKECGVRLARMLWPGATQGLYSVEELGGEE